MAIHRGIQSAIFFYLSCAPCAEARYRKNRKAEAERGRLERELIEAQNPNAYRQPSPSSTNPHWQSEIEAGPHLKSRGGKRRGGTNAGDNQRGVRSLSSRGSTRSGGQSSMDVRRREVRATNLDGSNAGDAISLPPRAVTRDRPLPESYGSYRPPQVSDLHPAVVTKVATKEEAAWLMEPPPIAEVMTGKDRVGRIRSDSSSSRPSIGRSTPLSRQLSARTMERQLSGNSTISLGRERSGSNSSGHLPPVPQERDFAMPTDPTIQTIHEAEASSSSAATVLHYPDLAPTIPLLDTPRKRPSRPQLSTIISETNVSPKQVLEQDYSSEYRDKVQRRPGIVVRDSSVKVLQELAPNSKLVNTQIVTATSTGAESDVELPSPDDAESHRLTSGPDLFDSWYTPDFQLDTWIHEHTKREVKQRWSMDI